MTSKPGSETPRFRTLTHHVTDDQRERLGIKHVRAITSDTYAVDGVPPADAAIDCEVGNLPGGMWASCRFRTVDGKRALVSMMLGTSVGDGAERYALTKGLLNEFPVRAINRELSALLRDLAEQGTDQDVVEVFGQVGVLPQFDRSRRAKAPANANSNWPRLLLLAREYNRLAGDPLHGGSVHKALVEEEGGAGLANTINTSKKLVKEARSAGFLRATESRSRGAELSGLAKFLLRQLYDLEDHRPVPQSTPWNYDHDAWAELIEEYYTTDVPERLEEQWDDFQKHDAPVIEAMNEASAEMKRRIMAGEFDEFLDQRAREREECLSGLSPSEALWEEYGNWQEDDEKGVVDGDRD